MISFVIPSKDEQDAISDTIRQIRSSFNNDTIEIIVVNDGSVDLTSQNARELGVKVIDHPHNLGYGAALKTGIRAAKHDVICIMDADGTYPPDQAIKLLEEYRKGYHMVVGARTGNAYFESIIKYPLRLFLKFLVEFTAGRNIPDINSGLRFFSRSEVIPYFGHLSNTFSFTTSLTLAYMMTGKFVAYVPVSYHNRIGKTKVKLVRDALRTLQFIIQAIVYYNPLKLFMLLVIAVLFIAVICFALGFFLSLPGFYYTGIVSILSSVVIFGIGLVAELIRQIALKDYPED